MQPKSFNQTRLLANLMTKGVSKSLTRSGDAHYVVPVAAVLLETGAGAWQDFGALLLEGRQFVVSHSGVKDQRTPNEMPDENRQQVPSR